MHVRPDLDTGWPEPILPPLRDHPQARPPVNGARASAGGIPRLGGRPRATPCSRDREIHVLVALQAASGEEDTKAQPGGARHGTDSRTGDFGGGVRSEVRGAALAIETMTWVALRHRESMSRKADAPRSRRRRSRPLQRDADGPRSLNGSAEQGTRLQVRLGPGRFVVRPHRVELSTGPNAIGRSFVRCCPSRSRGGVRDAVRRGGGGARGGGHGAAA